MVGNLLLCFLKSLVNVLRVNILFSTASIRLLNSGILLERVNPFEILVEAGDLRSSESFKKGR